MAVIIRVKVPIFRVRLVKGHQGLHLALAAPQLRVSGEPEGGGQRVGGWVKGHSRLLDPAFLQGSLLLQGGSLNSGEEIQQTEVVDCKWVN